MPPNQDIPVDLIISAQSCSQAAEDQLFTFLSARIHSLAQQRYWSGQREGTYQSKDIAQQVLLVLCDLDEATGKKKYKIISSDRFIEYVMLTLKNKIGDRIKEHSWKTFISVEQFRDRFLSSDDTERFSSPDWLTDDAIVDAMRKLRPKDRRIFRALLLECYGYELPEPFRTLEKQDWYVWKCRCLNRLRKNLKK